MIEIPLVTLAVLLGVIGLMLVLRLYDGLRNLAARALDAGGPDESA